jgi:CheY-like chemotaxis protein
MADKSAVECPQCGHINQPTSERCVQCGLDLEWARENWDECVAGPSESHPPLILVVNDEPATLKLMEIMLNRGGYRVAKAHDAFEALELTRHFVPNLIITDDAMPGMRGRDMITHLKATPALQSVPVVMLSPRCDRESIRGALDAGAICFHPVPIHHQDLCAIVASVLADETDFPKGCIRA